MSFSRHVCYVCFIRVPFSLSFENVCASQPQAVNEYVGGCAARRVPVHLFLVPMRRSESADAMERERR
jgi:hypothetical protein